MLVVFSLYDETDTYSESFIENYAKINLIPQVQRVQGVGDANVLGRGLFYAYLVTTGRHGTIQART